VDYEILILVLQASHFQVEYGIQNGHLIHTLLPCRLPFMSKFSRVLRFIAPPEALPAASSDGAQ
jgi:hypothetical protein